MGISFLATTPLHVPPARKPRGSMGQGQKGKWSLSGEESVPPACPVARSFDLPFVPLQRRALVSCGACWKPGSDRSSVIPVWLTGTISSSDSVLHSRGKGQTQTWSIAAVWLGPFLPLLSSHALEANGRHATDKLQGLPLAPWEGQKASCSPQAVSAIAAEQITPMSVISANIYKLSLKGQ